MKNSKRLLHYIHPTHAIGDVHPFLYDGTLFLYYLKPGGKYESALLCSDDFLHWEETDIRHEPDQLQPPQRPYFVLGLFHDSSSRQFRSYIGSDNIMRGSVSEDLLTWRAAGEAYNVLAQPGYSILRDPFLFWNDEEQLYWIIMTGRKGGDINGPNGGIAYASSPDMKTWTPRGDLYYHGNMGDPECPEMFRIKDKWYLLYSIYDHAVGRPNYLVSDRSTGPWVALDDHDCLDGSDLGAAQTIAYGAGRLMFGWIPLQDKETLGHQYWGGHLAFPREIYQCQDGSLASKLETTVGEKIRGNPLLSIERMNVDSPQNKEELPGIYERIDLEGAIHWGVACERAVISLQGSGEQFPTQIVFNRSEGQLVISTNGTVHSDMSARLSSSSQVRLIVEEDIVELFVDNRYSLAARISVKLHEFQVSVSVDGGAAICKDLRIYSLREGE
jgi:sucrose-6-phosphate hydrolase SacC (GH32 family)